MQGHKYLCCIILHLIIGHFSFSFFLMNSTDSRWLVEGHCVVENTFLTLIIHITPYIRIYTEYGYGGGVCIIPYNTYSV